MPKVRSKPKKEKLPLTRGRPKKHPVATSTSASEVDEEEENHSEVEGASASAVSSSEQEHRNKETDEESSSVTSHGSKASAKPKSKKARSKKALPAPEVGVEAGTNDVKQGDEEGIEDMPDLVAELRGNSGSVVTYVTKDVRHRQFELNARKELLQIYNEIEMLKETLDSSLDVARRLCPDSKDGNVAEAVKTLGFPKTFLDLMCKLMAAQPPESSFPLMQEPLFEESEDELQLETGEAATTATPSRGKTPQTMFPSPAKMAKYATPTQNNNGGIFQFGAKSNRKGLLSTSKAPRPPKSGEIVFSERGSPILQRRLPDDLLSKPMERVELMQEDGSKIEIDMVYRGAQDANRLQGFKEFAKDVRSIAATRSTVKQNRVQAPRVLKGVTQSASKTTRVWR